MLHDSRIQGSCRLDSFHQLQLTLSTCLDAVCEWPTGYSSIRQRRKSCGARHHVDNTRYRQLLSVSVPAQLLQRLLSVIWASTLTVISMRTQVTWTVAGSFADPVFQSLVVSLVLTKLDYGNAMLTGLPAYQYCRLQSVLNAAARLIYRRRRFDHVTSLLRELH